MRIATLCMTFVPFVAPSYLVHLPQIRLVGIGPSITRLIVSQSHTRAEVMPS